MDKFEKSIVRLSHWFDLVAQLALAIMMLIVVANILFRAIWQSIPGTYEIAGYLGVIVIGFALAYCAVKGRFVAITIFVERLPGRIQDIIGIIIGIISFALFIIAAWYCGRLATDILLAGEVSPTMRFPFYPLIYALAFCCLLLSLALLINVFKLFIKVTRR